MKRLLLIVGLSAALVGCQSTPVIEGSETAKRACESTADFSRGLGDAALLPGVWAVGRGDRNDFPFSVARSGNPETEVQDAMNDWRARQRRAGSSAELVFGMGVSGEFISDIDLAAFGARRDLHREVARAKALGHIVDQRMAVSKTEVSSNASRDRLAIERDAAGTMFGALVVEQKEAYVDGKYLVAVLVTWSAKIEELYRGAALGCLMTEQSGNRMSKGEIDQAISVALASEQSFGVPSGSHKVVSADGTFGYLGFGSARLDASDINAARERALLLSRAQTLRAVFSEVALVSRSEITTLITEADVAIQSEVNERVDSALEGIRLPGIRRLAERTLIDPLTGEEYVVVVSGIFPEPSSRTAEQLRSIITSRFADSAKKLGLSGI